MLIQKINEKQNIFGDEIGFVENWDFSRANLNEENRILAITQVASICYQNPKALGSESLYNRLAAESQGLPSSSFEFVPVLLDTHKDRHKEILYDSHILSNIYKYGEEIANKYILTNYRAIYYDYEQKIKEIKEYYNSTVASPENDINYHEDLKILKERYLGLFNTEEECEIIKEHFKVFLFKVDFPTRSQMVRHRISLQELSRRYVSGERVPFEFYVSDKMKNVTSTAEKEIWFEKDDGSESTRTGIFDQTTQSIIDDCLAHYKQALADGVKPQEARRIIPQAAYTQIWGAFQPKQLDNYFNLRLDKHSQWEIQQTAIAMKELIGKPEQEIQEGL